jgi:hypothetical protein
VLTPPPPPPPHPPGTGRAAGRRVAGGAGRREARLTGRRTPLRAQVEAGVLPAFRVVLGYLAVNPPQGPRPYHSLPPVPSGHVSSLPPY